MGMYYFDYFVKRVAFIGIEAESEQEARKLFHRASLDWQFVQECVDLTESMEPCDSWGEFMGNENPDYDPDYGDADFTKLAHERADAYERQCAARSARASAKTDAA